MTFDEFFKKATGQKHVPYPSQRKLTKAELGMPDSGLAIVDFGYLD